MITSLKPNQVFVFGSNLEGAHLGGAAKQAYESFGAIWGVGIGLMGQAYAIPTMFENVQEIKPFVEQFRQYAEQMPDKEFLLTRIGCGIAGFTDEEISPLFENMPDNVIKPSEWVKQRAIITNNKEEK